MSTVSTMANTVLERGIDVLKQHPQAAGTISCLALIVFARLRRKRPANLDLRGPKSTSWIFGVSVDLFKAMNTGYIYESWSKLYGSAYRIPLAFGDESIVLMDPKALATLFSRDTITYQQTAAAREFLERTFGNMLLIAEGEDHKRQRRSLSSGFSIAAIRNLTPIFLESAYHVKDSWDKIINSNDGTSATIEVGHWINAITFDGIGRGGFSHDFGATQGKPSLLRERFDAFDGLKLNFSTIAAVLLSRVFPSINLPTERTRLIAELSACIRDVAIDLIEKGKAEKELDVDNGLNKSILGALVRAETASANIHMDVEEIKAQILLMLAGYQTVSAAMVWCIVELARNPEVQRKLREELSELTDDDPSYEQLSSSLPYLDAVVYETLRLHPSLPEINRQAQVDDALPLSTPLTNAKGETIQNLPVPAGAKIRIPIDAVNLSEELWGEDSHSFNPSRWIDGTKNLRAEEVSGFRHLLTFADGPRTCLGRLFALTEFKAALSVLVRNYSFELPHGVDTKIALHRRFTVRPKLEGEEGPTLPMIVKLINR